jgi:transcriptional regulator with XRE-family HTH domain
MKKIENSECLVGFGEFIKKGREKKDMYQSEVAELAGITQAYYSMIERGLREPDLTVAMKICQVLRLDLSDFISPYM